MEDLYYTIRQPSSEILFKEKKSKFFGYAYPISTEDEIKSLLEKIQKKHPTANHICYAWQLGIEPVSYRAYDDGEPTNTAGMPIYGQIQSFGVTNVLVIVARVFGGTKLGTGGLIAAYRHAAKMSLEGTKIIQKTLKEYIKLSFQYENINIIMRTIKQQKVTIHSQQLDLACELVISVRKNDAAEVRRLFKAIKGVGVFST
ncbi:IMPACT family protein [Pareuzebyella sediminis]|uniref:IMPACT family protein n=1 Tax=Pareuzebyella sediminis TaxID=2607998 RepID=UPI0011EE7C48|nr:YigZ family protein [Pareuzebyella sediminis]